MTKLNLRYIHLLNNHDHFCECVNGPLMISILSHSLLQIIPLTITQRRCNILTNIKFIMNHWLNL